MSTRSCFLECSALGRTSPPTCLRAYASCGRRWRRCAMADALWEFVPDDEAEPAVE
jgi:hypothetical protein